MMNSRSSGALEVRFDIFPKHISSTILRRNSTACVGWGSKWIAVLPSFRICESINSSLISSSQVLRTQNCLDHSIMLNTCLKKMCVSCLEGSSSFSDPNTILGRCILSCPYNYFPQKYLWATRHLPPSETGHQSVYASRETPLRCTT